MKKGKSRHKTKSYLQTVDWEGVFCIAIVWLIMIVGMGCIKDGVNKRRVRRKNK